MNELETFRTDLARLRCEWAALKFMHAARKLQRVLTGKAGFNPDQPRVPAGNPDGGQWTADGGFLLPRLGYDPGRREEGERVRVAQLGGHRHDFGLSDVEALTQIAEDNARRYSVDLEEEKRRGGHAIQRHVGRSDGELLDEVRQDRFSSFTFTIARRRMGSFASLESANDFVNRVLERNQAIVDQVAMGKIPEEFIRERFGYATGKEAFQPPDLRTNPYIRTTYGVGVYIIHDRRSPRGYYVRTAYPTND